MISRPRTADTVEAARRPAAARIALEVEAAAERSMAFSFGECGAVSSTLLLPFGNTVYIIPVVS